jgi:hypothetical protein
VTRHDNNSGTNISVAGFGSSAASSVRRGSLPASAPPSISAGKSPSVESSVAAGTQLTEKSLEKLTGACGDDPCLQWALPTWEMFKGKNWPTTVVSPENGAHDQPGHLEHDLPEPLLGSSNGFSAHSTRAMTSDDHALRIYATEMFLHHVEAADKNDADPSELLEMIRIEESAHGGRSCWFKWCCLNDGIRSNTTPAHFAATHNLHSWIKWYARSSSHRSVLTKRGGDKRYPLLAAIVCGHDSIVASLSDYVDAETVPGDPWMLLHYVAANKVKADTTLARRRFNHDLTEELLARSASLLSTKRGTSDYASFETYFDTYKFRGWLDRHGVEIREFQSMLVSIQALNSTDELLLATEAPGRSEIASFLDDIMVQRINYQIIH